MRRSNLEHSSEIGWSGGFGRAGWRWDIAGALLCGGLRRRQPIQRYRGPFGLRSCAIHWGTQRGGSGLGEGFSPVQGGASIASEVN